MKIEIKNLGGFLTLVNTLQKMVPGAKFTVDRNGVRVKAITDNKTVRAFLSSGCGVRGDVPAACALGSPAGGALIVYFLAARHAGTAIENPRQLPAYDYPAEYGAFSPTFSRAEMAP